MSPRTFLRFPTAKIASILICGLFFIWQHHWLEYSILLKTARSQSHNIIKRFWNLLLTKTRATVRRRFKANLIIQRRLRRQINGREREGRAVGLGRSLGESGRGRIIKSAGSDDGGFKRGSLSLSLSLSRIRFTKEHCDRSTSGVKTFTTART